MLNGLAAIQVDGFTLCSYPIDLWTVVAKKKPRHVPGLLEAMGLRCEL